MGCKDNESVLQGYFDGELDLVRSLEFERHLKTCPECSRELSQQQIMRESLRAASLREFAPEGLRNRIRGALPNSAVARTAKPISRRAIYGNTVQWLAIAAAILIALFVGANLFPNLEMFPNIGQRLQSNFVAQQIVAEHIRSLQPGHLFDVQSTDQHTVKPWFDGRVSFAPPVIDLAGQGFPLVGGRLDYVDNVTAAALVYQRQKHFINVFVWPQEAKPAKLPGTSAIQGYNLIFWRRGGMNFCAASNLNAAELRGFVELLQK